VVFANDYGNTADKVIFENFERIARGIGEYANIAKLINDKGIREAEKKFGLNRYDHRYPVLIITDKHPAKWIEGDKAIRVQLGNFGSEDDIRDFLSKLATAVKDGELDRLQWSLRKKKMKEIAGKIPIVDIVTAAAGGLCHTSGPGTQ
jgi:hypothetical protein